ncbi:MAG: glycosyltransferase [Puia sp.]|nr:glycosyltransferase [Puia sp.]
MNDKNRYGVLVILSPGFPGSEADSTCIPPQQVFVSQLKKEYPALPILVIAFQYPFAATEYSWNDVRVVSLGGRNRGKLYRVFIWYKAWRLLKKVRREQGVKGLFSFWCGECALVGKWFGRKYAIKHHCWILGQDAKKENNYIKWIRPIGGELVALSDFIAGEFFRNHGILPARIIPVGVDPMLYDQGPVEKDIDVLGAGALIPLKNYELFLHAIYFCRKRLPGIKAIICGKGPEEKRLRELIALLKLEENVCLAGERDHAGVLRLMQRSRIFLHPSTYEGFGAVCVEALYAGARVISFVKPMDEDIPGWQIVGSSREMVHEILEALQDPEREWRPYLAYSIRDSARAVMKLFDDGDGLVVG